MITTKAALAGVLLGSVLAGCGGNPAPARPAPGELASPANPAPPGNAAPPTGDRACSPAVSIDGFSDELDETTLRDSYVGNLSALAVDQGGSILALSDRSVLFPLDPGTLRPTAATALRDEQGEPLDSEGLVVDRDGTRLVSSEVEPSVRRYAPDGALLGRLPVPAALLVAPAGRAGRNLTFEGLTLLPDGRTLVASMEGVLAGDQGNVVRFQTWTRDAGEFTTGAQYGYPVDGGFGVSEISSTGDGRLLVLERTYLPGVGNGVRLYLADPAGAADISGVDQLGTDHRPIGKTLLADLGRCPSLDAQARQPQPNPLLDNVEGMTIAGRDPDGALHLLLVSDDNQRPEQTTRIYRLTARLAR